MERDYLLRPPCTMKIISEEARARGLSPDALLARYAPMRPAPKLVWEARKAVVVRAKFLGKSLSTIARAFGHDRSAIKYWLAGQPSRSAP